MVTDEFRPDVGKRLFLQHRAELEQGLRQIASALGRDQEFQNPEDFFHDFISGFWDPYEEVCETGNKQQKAITEELRTLAKQICHALSPDKRDLCERYSDLMAERNSTALDYAFLVGYQCAFRFLLLGVLPAKGAFLRGAGEPDQTGASETGTPDSAQKIYTHDEAALIVEMFEDVLDKHGIKIPSPEDDEREPDNEAKLYGSVYYGLLDAVESNIIDLLSRHSRGGSVVQNEFSGGV